MSETPFRKVVIGGALFDLRFNQRALRTVQQVTGKHYKQVISEFLQDDPEAYQAMLWALTSTYRVTAGISYAVTDSEVREKVRIPGAFLDSLPMGDKHKAIDKAIYEMCIEAGYVKPAKAIPGGPAEPDPSPGDSVPPKTSTEESLTPLPAAD